MLRLPSRVADCSFTTWALLIQWRRFVKRCIDEPVFSRVRIWPLVSHRSKQYPNCYSYHKNPSTERVNLDCPSSTCAAAWNRVLIIGPSTLRRQLHRFLEKEHLGKLYQRRQGVGRYNHVCGLHSRAPTLVSHFILRYPEQEYTCWMTRHPRLCPINISGLWRSCRAHTSLVY